MSRLSSETIRSWKPTGRKISALTAYDYPTAKLLDESGIDLILVGDSLGMTVLGYSDTTHVQIEDVIYHTRAVSRATGSALLAADLPIHTYETPELAARNASRLISAGADAVKLEGGQACAEQIRKITDAGIPFIGHIGMLPQHIKEEGGYKRKGKTPEERRFLVEEAKTIERCGGFAVVLELIEPAAAEEITASVSIPTIGIGSGPGCDGQILVFHDLVGYFPWFVPRHARPEADLAQTIRNAAAAFIKRNAGE